MHTILLVEDEPVVALSQKAVLAAHGYDVRVVYDGVAAVEAVKTHSKIDLVLMDIDLSSGMDGAEAAEAILAHRDIPVVFWTCHTERDIVERVQSISGYGYVVKSSGEFVLIESIRMALRLFEANTTLKSRTEFIETVIDHLPIGLGATYFEDGRTSYLNREFERIYGWPFEVLSNIDRFFETVYPDEKYRQEIKSQVMEDLASGDPARMIWDGVRITTQNGEERVVRAQNIPVPGQNLVISTVIDRTVQARAERLLRESERNYRTLLESLQEGIIHIDADGRIVYVNEPMANMIGYDGDDMRGHLLSDFMDGEGRQIVADAIKRRRQGISEHMEAHFLHRSGHRVYVLVATAPLFSDNGDYVGAVAGIMDIGPQKSHELELQTQIAQKNMLFREMHHRIKNNIGSVASLLSMQAATMDEPAARQAVYEALGRVQSMQKLYDVMLPEKSREHVAVDTYLSSILEAIFELYNRDSSIQVRTSLVSCGVPSADAFAIGIMVNELLTNIMKYAFTGQSDREISVSLASHRGQSVLCVRDNGRGFPDDALHARSDSGSDSASGGFGLSLVRLLCEQLDAELRLYNDNGAVAEIRFACA